MCHLYAVEGSALLLVQQCVVVGQLHKLVQLLVGIFLLQLLQDTNHLRDRQQDTLMNKTRKMPGTFPLAV